jgi:thiamine-phosphate pyrophosphorylase
MKASFKNLSERRAAFDAVDLYPVITSDFCNGRHPLDVLRQVAAGGATLVQLREKHLDKGEYYQLACRFREVTREFGMLLIINDHVDIALAVEADGVHLGQEDLPLTAARKIAPELLIGVSTHNPEEAAQAVRDGAGYINIGPIYATGTKAVNCGPVGVEMLKAIAPTLPIPFSIMGGIKAQHIPELVRMGAKRIAMVTEITQADDIRLQTESLRRLMA